MATNYAGGSNTFNESTPYVESQSWWERLLPGSTTQAVTTQATNPYSSSGLSTSSAYDDFLKYGLNTAAGLMGKAPSEYPTYIPSQAQSPAQMDYYNYTPTSPIAQVQAPNYQMTAKEATPYSAINPNASAAGFSWQGFNQAAPTYSGLMSGDYAALQKALATPGELAATNAYNQGSVKLADVMGGKGLYGSSIMQNQQTQGLDKVFQEALAANAANAAASRYGFEQSDLQKAADLRLAGWQGLLGENTARNQANLDYAGMLTNTNIANAQNAISQNNAMNNYNLTSRGQDLGRESDINKYAAQNYSTGVDQAKNIFASNLASNQDANSYNANRLSWQKTLADQLTDWQNKQGSDLYNYNLAKASYQNAADESLMNRALALAGLGNTANTASSNASNAYQTLLAQQAAAGQASNASNTAAYLAALGQLGGGLLSNKTAASAIGNGLSTAGSTVYDWLSSLFS